MKKSIKLLTISALILSSASIANAATISEAQKDDLFNLNIMVGDENGNLNLDKSLTRAEAVRIICSASKIEAENTEASFPDVSKNHWAYKYICAAADAGITVGDENGNFNPDNTVTNEEFVKMICCLLGYDTYADFMGGYPAGHAAVVSQLGITQDLELIPGKAVIRNDVGIMISKSLDAPLLITNDDGTYFVADGTNDAPTQTLRTLYHSK